jgi:predicted phage terminase large subunit-like protein
LSNKNIPSITVIKSERCKRSLFYFAKEFWDVIITDPYIHNFHIEYMCDEIQLVIDKYVLDRKPHISDDKWYKGMTENIKKNLIFNIPPGTSKSTIASRIAPAWIWAIDSSKTAITNTVSQTNANEFSSKSKDIIESDKFKSYFPTVKIRRDVSAKTFYQTEKGGVRYSFSTNGSVTGKHASILIDDDRMDVGIADSPAERKRAINQFKALQTRKKDKAKTPYILVEQRLSSKDTTAHCLTVFKDECRHICLPAENIYKNIEPKEIEKFYIDGLLDPVRLNRDILKSTRMGLTDESKPISEIAYNIQFNQVSETVEGLLYGKLNFVKSLPENRDGIIRYSFTDVADTGSDYFATPFVEINKNKIYVFDAIYTQESSGITSKKIKSKIEQHNSVVNKIETNNQGSVFVTLLQTMGVNVSGYYSTGNKEERISAWAQFISFIYFVEPNENSSTEYIQFIKHLQAYPKVGKHDDGHDDAEDAITEMLRYIWTNLRYLFTIENLQ